MNEFIREAIEAMDGIDKEVEMVYERVRIRNLVRKVNKEVEILKGET